MLEPSEFPAELLTLLESYLNAEEIIEIKQGKKQLTIDILYKDKNQKTLLQLVQKSNNPLLLNYLFSLAQAQESEFAKLLELAISLRQDYKKILYFVVKKIWPEGEVGEPLLENDYLNHYFADETLLIMASQNGHLPLLNYLLEQPAIEVDKKSRGGDSGTALWKAICEGHADVVAALVKAGAKLLPIKDMSPMAKAIELGDIAVVQAMMESKPAWNKERDNNGYTPLMLAAKEGKLAIVQYFLTQPGVTLDAVCEAPAYWSEAFSALHLAIANNRREVVNSLLKAGANVAGNLSSRSPLPIHFAIAKGNLDAVKAIIEKNPQLLNQINATGKTPLMTAVIENKLEIARYLINQQEVAQEVKAFHLAIIRNNLEMVKLFLENKPNLLNQSIEEEQRFTPLMQAVKVGSLDIVDYLLEREGIDVVASRYGQTAFQDASYLDDPRIANRLLKYGQDKVAINKSELSGREKAKLAVMEYISKRKTEALYKTSFNFCFFKLNFGFSREEKVAAAEALTRVMVNNAHQSILKAHKGALNNGELKTLYRQYLSTKDDKPTERLNRFSGYKMR